MLRNVYFEGEMGDRFIPSLQMNCETASQALQCLGANFDEFIPWLIEKHEEDVQFHIEVAGSEIEYIEECYMEIGEGDITITPVPAGSKKGIGKLIVAAVLVAVTIKFPGLSKTLFTIGEGAGAITVTAAGIMKGVALSLAIAGISEMMLPDPSVDGSLEDDRSYLFDGSSQNIIQGDPVPVLYGRLRVPGQPIGFEIAGANSRTTSMTGGNGSSFQDGASSFFRVKTRDHAGGGGHGRR